MWTSIKQFFIDNQSSIIVSIVVGALFFILGPLGLWFSGKKVKREKISKAKSELLDLIESMLVNKEHISISKLLTLYRAIERQNSINLGIDSDLNNVLEDLSLRFAKSKHLSADQKDGYQKQIDDLIVELSTPKNTDVEEKLPTQNQREIPKSLKSIIDALREETKEIKSEKLSETIDQLEKKYRRPTDPFFILSRMIRERPKLMFTVIIIYFIVIALFLYFKESLK